MGGRNRDMGQAMSDELKRQAASRLLASGHGQFRPYLNMYHQLTTGGLRNPRLLISLAVSAVVLFGGAVTTCAGIVTAWWANR